MDVITRKKGASGPKPPLIYHNTVKSHTSTRVLYWTHNIGLALREGPYPTAHRQQPFLWILWPAHTEVVEKNQLPIYCDLGAHAKLHVGTVTF